ncbi:MAG TPA: ABC transporter permease subunit [bacterium]|nr:ABC transporter permease subunit [Dictyoglomota bacterium]HHV81956.1 ABC transporter permease subunit [bacterium]HOK29214.1 ABC transporter permease subunit [bacterium]HOP55851.1 ABC transporter permease subunit [bacterium]HPC77115.1 ABC transporter permease subunit [bacterium]
MVYRIVPPKRIKISIIDIGIILFLSAFIYGIISTAKDWGEIPVYALNISLSPVNLPYYAWLSVLRQFLAYLLSLGFSITYGYVASHNKRLEPIMISLLDILQSVPVLSFMPGVILGLMALFPYGRVGIELGSIVLIFTGQVWNMAFSVYSSMSSLPREFREASEIFNLTPLQRFLYVELPYSTIGLVWNSMMSVAGGWFFLMACEMFTLGERDFRLPGLGSYLQLAAIEGDTEAVLMGLATMIAIIVIIDQLVWRPLIAWSQKFKVELATEEIIPTSIVLTVIERSTLILKIGGVINTLMEKISAGFSRTTPRKSRGKSPFIFILRIIIIGILALILGYASIRLFLLISGIPVNKWGEIMINDLFTLFRVSIAVVLSILWTLPLGVFIGTNPRLSSVMQPLVQILASIPATAVFPIILMWLLSMRGGLSIASILLMLLGTQWYLLFNIIAGAMSIPADLKEAADVFQLKGVERWRKLIIPAVLPYLVTGGITATGGAWNASIVSEYVHFRGQILTVRGLGAMISSSADKGDISLLAGSTIVMIITVTLINRFFWRRLYWLAEEHYSL